MRHQDTEELTRLRAAFSSGDWPARSQRCPEADLLWASAAGTLDRSADKGVFLHLSQCQECSAVWKIAREMLAEDEAPGAPVIAFDDHVNRPIWRRTPALAAAASLLIGAGLGAYWMMEPKVPSQPVYREQRESNDIQASEESRRVSREACRLRWSGGPDGSRWDLVITTSDLDVLEDVKNLDRPEYLLSPEKLPQGGSKILWRVTAHLPDRRTVSSRTFTTEVVDAPLAPAEGRRESAGN